MIIVVQLFILVMSRHIDASMLLAILIDVTSASNKNDFMYKTLAELCVILC